MTRGRVMWGAAMRTLVLLPLLAACTSVRPPAENYRALGTEPFWSVTIERGRMRYEDVEGREIDVAAPVASTAAGGRRYATPELSMTVTAGPCSDGMSDRVYRDAVAVAVGARQLRGCGGRATDR